MIPSEIRRMYNILVCFLGPSKDELDESYQLQFSCPRCQEREGSGERNKFHLEINIQKGIYNCWKCSSIDSEMHGTVYKLIRKYGNPTLLKEYKDAVSAFKETSLYKISFSKDDFQSDYEDKTDEGLILPNGYTKFIKNRDENTPQFQYLSKRGVDWPIIDKFNIGFTTYQEKVKSLSKRIILPSFDQFGELNYWTGRDYTCNPKRQRYYNPIIERKNIIFNEDKVDWNADITLVEGPFDHIVVPNSIPLLGKNLNREFYLYKALFERCHANINIFLDVDAFATVRSLYKTLNEGVLRDRIKYIPIEDSTNSLDPSKIFELWGRKGIIAFLRGAKKFNENELI